MVLRNALLVVLFISYLSSCKEDGFVSSLYSSKTPLAAIRNLPIMSEQACAFSLTEDTTVQIYASGEAGIDMVNVDPVYLYKPDAVEVYLKQQAGKELSFNFPLQDPVGSGAAVEYHTNGVGFVAAYDSIRRLYQAKLSMPFSVIGNQGGNAGEKVMLNVVLADNDDYTKQKAKLAWMGNRDPMLNPELPYGEIMPGKDSNDTTADAAGYLVSYPMPVGKGMTDSLPAVAISQLIFGQVNEPSDFSAQMRSAWDRDTLFLYFTILDNKEGKIDPKRLKGLSNFHDWGWIEDEKGNVVWKMTNLQTRHAGGAQKNRKVDTAVSLKKGKYKLKYITDESHSWNNWDDEPPALPFYGIELFVKGR